MTRYLRTFLAAGLVLAAASTSQAQQVLRFTVPFAFIAGDAEMARGTYQVSKLHGHADALLVNGTRDRAFVLGQPDTQPIDAANGPILVFHRYGTLNFLREIRFADGSAVDVPESQQERDAAERRALAFEVIELLAGR